MAQAKLKISLLSRPGCHLCHEALTVLEELSEELPLEVTEVDISKDLRLLELYRNDIPVGLVEGRELFRHRAKRADLRRLLSGEPFSR